MFSKVKALNFAEVHQNLHRFSWCFQFNIQMVLWESALMSFRLLVSAWNLKANFSEGKQMGECSLLSFNSLKSLSSLWFYVPRWVVPVCFWAFSLCSILWTSIFFFRNSCLFFFFSFFLLFAGFIFLNDKGWVVELSLALIRMGSNCLLWWWWLLQTALAVGLWNGTCFVLLTWNHTLA